MSPHAESGLRSSPLRRATADPSPTTQQDRREARRRARQRREDGQFNLQVSQAALARERREQKQSLRKKAAKQSSVFGVADFKVVTKDGKLVAQPEQSAVQREQREQRQQFVSRVESRVKSQGFNIDLGLSAAVIEDGQIKLSKSAKQRLNNLSRTTTTTRTRTRQLSLQEQKQRAAKQFPGPIDPNEVTKTGTNDQGKNLFGLTTEGQIERLAETEVNPQDSLPSGFEQAVLQLNLSDQLTGEQTVNLAKNARREQIETTVKDTINRDITVTEQTPAELKPALADLAMSDTITGQELVDVTQSLNFESPPERRIEAAAGTEVDPQTVLTGGIDDALNQLNQSDQLTGEQTIRAVDNLQDQQTVETLEGLTGANLTVPQEKDVPSNLKDAAGQFAIEGQLSGADLNQFAGEVQDQQIINSVEQFAGANLDVPQSTDVPQNPVEAAGQFGTSGRLSGSELNTFAENVQDQQIGATIEQLTGADVSVSASQDLPSDPIAAAGQLGTQGQLSSQDLATLGNEVQDQRTAAAVEQLTGGDVSVGRGQDLPSDTVTAGVQLFQSGELSQSQFQQFAQSVSDRAAEGAQGITGQDVVLREQGGEFVPQVSEQAQRRETAENVLAGSVFAGDVTQLSERAQEALAQRSPFQAGDVGQTDSGSARLAEAAVRREAAEDFSQAFGFDVAPEQLVETEQGLQPGNEALIERFQRQIGGEAGLSASVTVQGSGASRRVSLTEAGEQEVVAARTRTGPSAEIAPAAPGIAAADRRDAAERFESQVNQRLQTLAGQLAGPGGNPLITPAEAAQTPDVDLTSEDVALGPNGAPTLSTAGRIQVAAVQTDLFEQGQPNDGQPTGLSAIGLAPQQDPTGLSAIGLAPREPLPAATNQPIVPQGGDVITGEGAPTNATGSQTGAAVPAPVGDPLFGDVRGVPASQTRAIVGNEEPGPTPPGEQGLRGDTVTPLRTFAGGVADTIEDAQDSPAAGFINDVAEAFGGAAQFTVEQGTEPVANATGDVFSLAQPGIEFRAGLNPTAQVFSPGAAERTLDSGAGVTNISNTQARFRDVFRAESEDVTDNTLLGRQAQSITSGAGRAAVGVTIGAPAALAQAGNIGLEATQFTGEAIEAQGALPGAQTAGQAAIATGQTVARQTAETARQRPLEFGGALLGGFVAGTLVSPFRLSRVDVDTDGSAGIPRPTRVSPDSETPNVAGIGLERPDTLTVRGLRVQTPRAAEVFGIRSRGGTIAGTRGGRPTLGAPSLAGQVDEIDLTSLGTTETATAEARSAFEADVFRTTARDVSDVAGERFAAAETIQRQAEVAQPSDFTVESAEEAVRQVRAVPERRAPEIVEALQDTDAAVFGSAAARAQVEDFREPRDLDIVVDDKSEAKPRLAEALEGTDATVSGVFDIKETAEVPGRARGGEEIKFGRTSLPMRELGGVPFNPVREELVRKAGASAFIREPGAAGTPELDVGPEPRSVGRPDVRVKDVQDTQALAQEVGVFDPALRRFEQAFDLEGTVPESQPSLFGGGVRGNVGDAQIGLNDRAMIGGGRQDAPDDEELSRREFMQRTGETAAAATVFPDLGIDPSGLFSGGFRQRVRNLFGTDTAEIQAERAESRLQEVGELTPLGLRRELNLGEREASLSEGEFAEFLETELTRTDINTETVRQAVAQGNVDTESVFNRIDDFELSQRRGETDLESESTFPDRLDPDEIGAEIRAFEDRVTGDVTDTQRVRARRDTGSRFTRPREGDSDAVSPSPGRGDADTTLTLTSASGGTRGTDTTVSGGLFGDTPDSPFTTTDTGSPFGTGGGGRTSSPTTTTPDRDSPVGEIGGGGSLFGLGGQQSPTDATGDTQQNPVGRVPTNTEVTPGGGTPTSPVETGAGDTPTSGGFGTPDTTSAFGGIPTDTPTSPFGGQPTSPIGSPPGGPDSPGGGSPVFPPGGPGGIPGFRPPDSPPSSSPSPTGTVGIGGRNLLLNLGPPRRGNTDRRLEVEDRVDRDDEPPFFQDPFGSQFVNPIQSSFEGLEALAERFDRDSETASLFGGPPQR